MNTIMPFKHEFYIVQYLRYPKYSADCKIYCHPSKLTKNNFFYIKYIKYRWSPIA